MYNNRIVLCESIFCVYNQKGMCEIGYVIAVGEDNQCANFCPVKIPYKFLEEEKAKCREAIENEMFF